MWIAVGGCGAPTLPAGVPLDPALVPVAPHTVGDRNVAACDRFVADQSCVGLVGTEMFPDRYCETYRNLCPLAAYFDCLDENTYCDQYLHVDDHGQCIDLQCDPADTG